MSRAETPSSGAGDGATTATEPLFDLLWQVTAYTHLISEAALADTPLTVSSSSMLLTVAEQPGSTVADISRRIPKTQQTISQVVARLEKLGLIERRLGTGRGVGLHLTDEGREMAQTARAHERQLADGLRELLGAERADALTTLLAESRELLAQAADDSA
jgi:DNA-binding MarR family transcriptional regulator